MNSVIDFLKEILNVDKSDEFKVSHILNMKIDTMRKTCRSIDDALSSKASLQELRDLSLDADKVLSCIQELDFADRDSIHLYNKLYKKYCLDYYRKDLETRIQSLKFVIENKEKRLKDWQKDVHNFFIGFTFIVGLVFDVFGNMLNDFTSKVLAFDLALVFFFVCCYIFILINGKRYQIL